MKHCCVIVGGLAEDEGRGQLERDTGGGIALVPQAQRQSTEWRQEDLAQLGRPWHIQSLEWSRAVEEELEAECGRQGEAAEDGGEETTMCALHSSKKKRACFRSQGGRIRRWDKTGQPIAGTGRGGHPLHKHPECKSQQERWCMEKESQVLPHRQVPQFLVPGLILEKQLNRRLRNLQHLVSFLI